MMNEKQLGYYVRIEVYTRSVYANYPFCIHRLHVLSIQITRSVYANYLFCVHRLPVLCTQIVRSVYTDSLKNFL